MFQPGNRTAGRVVKAAAMLGLLVLAVAVPSGRPWAQGRLWLSCFALSQPEKAFSRQLLQRKRNLWLYRCNQREFCGDFVVVDMSAVAPQLRVVFVIELKTGAELCVGGSGAGNQLQRAPLAVRELVDQSVVRQDSHVVLLCGSSEEVLAWLGNRSTKQW